MRAVFIPTQYIGKVDFSKIKLEKLPESIGIITTAQFQKKTEEIMDYLKKHGKKPFIGAIKQRNPGQLLGCDQGAADAVDKNVDAFLYIGSGDFHPLGVAMKTKKNVFLFNPVSSIFSQFDSEEIQKYHKKKKVMLTKYLTAQSIGILVSVKPGQYSYLQAKKIKQNLENEGKKAYIFVFDELHSYEMENFPFIEFWINTACPRIADDKDKRNMLDMADLDFLQKDLIKIK